VFLDHRLGVIQNRSQFDLARARERAHILQGLRVALKNLEEVIRLIRNARTAEDACGRLQKRYRLTQAQAEAILDMPLRRLASLEREKIEQEYKEKVALMASLERVLGSPKLQREALIEELRQLQQRFGDGRRTAILRDGDKLRNLPIAAQADHPEESVWLTLTDTGLLSRGGSSRQSLQLPHAPLKAVLRASTRDTLYLLTEKGRLAGIPIEAVPEREAHEPGVHFSTLCGLEGPSKVECAVSVPPSSKDREGYLTLVTRRGMVKKSRLQDLPRPSPQVVSAIKIAPQDALGWAAATSGKDELLLLTSAGMSIRFSEQEVRPLGLSAAGVLAVRLGRGGDQVAWAGVIQPRCDLLMIGEDGYARRTSITEFPLQGRHGVGTRAWKAKPGVRLVGAVAGRANTRILLCLRDGSAQSARLGDFSRHKRTSEASSAVKLGRGLRIAAVIALESPPLGADAARRPSSGAGHKPRGHGRPQLGRGKLAAHPDNMARKSKRDGKGKASGPTRGDRGQ
jgi:DNA gyrase subunit A